MLIYLASPYWHEDWIVRLNRYQEACRGAARLVEAGRLVFSPIAHAYSVAGCCAIPQAEMEVYWRKHSMLILSKCDALMILKLDGWEESRGIKAEIEYADANRMALTYLDPV